MNAKIPAADYPQPGFLSERVQYAMQLLADMEVVGCCNFDWLAQRYAEEFSFDKNLLRKILVRLALFGIVSYEPATTGEDIFLIMQPDRISMYALVSAIDREIDFANLDVGKRPQIEDALKEITVQHLIDAEYGIRHSSLRQDNSGRIRLATERERKTTEGDFMPMRHADCAAILDDKTLRDLLKKKRSARANEIIMRFRNTGVPV